MDFNSNNQAKLCVSHVHVETSMSMCIALSTGQYLSLSKIISLFFIFSHTNHSLICSYGVLSEIKLHTNKNKQKQNVITDAKQSNKKEQKLPWCPFYSLESLISDIARGV